MARKSKEVKASSGVDLFQALADQTNGELLSQMKAARYFIDTGNLAFNYIASGKFVQGGLPGGRISEFYGPSSSAKSLWATNLLFGCQKLDGYAILLDCENASNPEWIRKASHLDVDKVIRYTPKTLEEAFLKMYNVIKFIRKHDTNVPILIVYDSISVSPTEREYKEIDLPEGYSDADFKRIVQKKEQPGERAKVCSTELRKLNGLLEEMDATVLIINQTREKIGVMYGCFDYNSRVVMSDGTTEKIGKLVNRSKRCGSDFPPLEVMSFNPTTGKVEPRKIVNYFDNGDLTEDEIFLRFKVRKFGGNGVTQFACTPNHLIFAPVEKKLASYDLKDFQYEGGSPYREVRAGDLEVGDKILVTQPFYLTDRQRQLVYGSILGDGSIRSGHKEDSCSQLRVNHGIDQKPYCQWKEEIMSPWVSYIGDRDEQYGFDTIPMYELTKLRFRSSEGCVIPKEVADNLDAFSLAIWYMDDGTFGGNYAKWGNGKSTICSFKFSNREIMLPALKRLGLEAQLKKRGFVFDSKNTRKMHELIAPFVHPSMDYKLHPECRGRFSFEIEDVDESTIRYKAVPAEVLDVYEKPVSGSKRKFDLEIEGNHSYIVDGAIVHNSPETVAGGGKSLEFYCSQRFRTSAHAQIKNPKLGNMVTGVNVKITNKKNRFFRPHAYAEGIQLLFDRGINPLSGLLEVLIQAERIEASGGGGNFVVKPEYLPSNRLEYSFKSSKSRGDVPRDLVLDCPGIIDAESREEVEAYLAPYADFERLEQEGSLAEELLAEEASDY